MLVTFLLKIIQPKTGHCSFVYIFTYAVFTFTALLALVIFILVYSAARVLPSVHARCNLKCVMLSISLPWVHYTFPHLQKLLWMDLLSLHWDCLYRAMRLSFHHYTVFISVYCDCICSQCTGIVVTISVFVLWLHLHCTVICFTVSILRLHLECVVIICTVIRLHLECAVIRFTVYCDCV